MWGGAPVVLALTHPSPLPAAKLAVDAVMRVDQSLNLEQIQIIKMSGGSLKVRWEGGPCPATPLLRDDDPMKERSSFPG